MDIIYTTPTNRDFYILCLMRAVYIKFDRMNDDSWCRITSDKPLEWFLDNTDKITSSQFILRNHQLRNEDERWNKDNHIEINVELRENRQTYLLSIEIDSSFINFFSEKQLIK